MGNFEKKFKEELDKSKPKFADWAVEHAPQVLTSSQSRLKKRHFSLQRLIPVLSACLIFAVLLPMFTIFLSPNSVSNSPPSNEVDLPIYGDTELAGQDATLNEVERYVGNLSIFNIIQSMSFYVTSLKTSGKPVFIRIEGEYEVSTTQNYYSIILGVCLDRRYNFIDRPLYKNLKHSTIIDNRQITYDLFGKEDGIYNKYRLTYQENEIEYYYNVSCFDESIDELLTILF